MPLERERGLGYSLSLSRWMIKMDDHQVVLEFGLMHIPVFFPRLYFLSKLEAHLFAERQILHACRAWYLHENCNHVSLC